MELKNEVNIVLLMTVLPRIIYGDLYIKESPQMRLYYNSQVDILSPHFYKWETEARMLGSLPRLQGKQ